VKQSLKEETLQNEGEGYKNAAIILPRLRWGRRGGQRIRKRSIQHVRHFKGWESGEKEKSHEEGDSTVQHRKETQRRFVHQPASQREKAKTKKGNREKKWESPPSEKI